MAKMTPEQEASYALAFGIARSDLPPDAQRAYDRLVELRARAASTAPVLRAGAEAASGHIILPGRVAAVGTALVFLVGQGGGVVLLPYAFTRWLPGTPPWPVTVRAIGVALIAIGGIMVITGFFRFATEGTGIPFPAGPTSRQLTTGGPYRYVRNPLYLAIVMAVTGQALLSAARCSWSTRPCCSPPSPRSSTGMRSRRWPGASADNTRPTASRCPAGGRACHAERRDTAPHGKGVPRVPALPNRPRRQISWLCPICGLWGGMPPGLRCGFRATAAGAALIPVRVPGMPDSRAKTRGLSPVPVVIAQPDVSRFRSEGRRVWS
jgi:protein-S-isoprenylcysteine O-methyltransferase Ste14